jgi:DNA helicase-4
MVEKSPLTDEQIHACVCMDDSVLVVAAAGSGKTSTIVAKAGYALKEGLASPEGILLLAFNADAAKEVGERVLDRLAGVPDVEKITSLTFHAFGREVIGQVTGRKPSIAPWVEQPRKDIEEIVRIASCLSASDANFKRRWDLFRTVYVRDLGRFGSQANSDAHKGTRKAILTFNGEYVKSTEEERIANWLFFHGIDYVYEKPYEHDTADKSYAQYKPDFYYPALGLYHEHFALDANGKAPARFGKRYEEGVAWKRALHAEKGTAFFETTSAQCSDNSLFGKLEAELTHRGLKPLHDPNRQSERNGAAPMTEDKVAELIRVFQQHAKSNGAGPDELKNAMRRQFGIVHDVRFTMFLWIYERVSAEWERRLKAGGFIDFDDMLVQAVEHVEANRYRNPFTLILADEFQDSSRTRVRLLKALSQCPGAHRHLCVVGDDWQGINRFAGADISVMTKFEQMFEHATRLMLTTTFRCPQAICDASSRFIQENPRQIRKTVKTTNVLTKEPLQALAFKDDFRIPVHLGKLLNQMHGYVRDGRMTPVKGDRVSVLILGRYRRDEPFELEGWQKRFEKTLSVEFRTVHASKGLEAEYVFLLNAFEGRSGFPSQIEDDPILQIAMPDPDPFEFAEERRLFYVAMTRASRQFRVYTNTMKPSRFIMQARIPIVAVDGDEMETCPRCREGIMRLRKGPTGKFMGCTTYPKCKHTRNVEDAVNT